MGGSPRLGANLRAAHSVQGPPQGPDARDEALATLFDAHYARLVAAARFIVDDRESAEDVVMEAFVGLHRRWHHLRKGGEPAAYLRSSVLNGARSQLRRRRVRRLVEAPARDVAAADDVASAGADHVVLVRVLADLPPRQREVLVMRFFLGMHEAEVATELGITLGSVKQHSARGLAALGRSLEGSR